MALSDFKTEVIGISTEVAIADAYSIAISDAYRIRGNDEVVRRTTEIIKDLFARFNVPTPTRHIAEGQNPVDFEIGDDNTLSVKTNQKQGKVAPQNIGQPTAKTFWQKLHHLADDEISNDPQQLRQMFKRVALSKPEVLIANYWENLFDCDYLAYFWGFLDSRGDLKKSPQGLVLSKSESPPWDPEFFTFSQTLASWNESNTVKYRGIAIGEFQVHNNRDCLKFRFNMESVLSILDDRPRWFQD